MIELSALKPLHEAKVEIKHPVIEDIGVSFIVYGTDSKEYREAVREISLKKNDSLEPTDEEIELFSLEILTKSIKSFTGITDNGKPIPSTDENIKKVLTECEWIKEQISAFMINKSNFFLKK